MSSCVTSLTAEADGRLQTMEWPFNDPDFDEQDLDTILKYAVGKSVALLRNCGSRVSA